MEFKELLSRAGITKAELSRRVGITANAVSKWGNDPPMYAVAYLELLVSYNQAREWVPGVSHAIQRKVLRAKPEARHAALSPDSQARTIEDMIKG